MIYNGKEVRISLAACRVNANLTQEEMAKTLHVAKTTINNWENPDNPSQPNMEQLRRISELSGVPMDFIFVSSKSKDIG